MPREIWNEGRVVGQSAYEIYLRQHLAEDPDTPPATENEWLASSLARGTSMLLKVPPVYMDPDNPSEEIDLYDSDESKIHTIIQIPLPENSKLAAANTIVAEYFDGDGYFENGSDWASHITSYGEVNKLYTSPNQLGSQHGSMIPNDHNTHPVEGDIMGDYINTHNIPMYGQSLRNWVNLDALKNYAKIIDGVIIQPGEWGEHESRWTGWTYTGYNHYDDKIPGRPAPINYYMYKYIVSCKPVYSENQEISYVEATIRVGFRNPADEYLRETISITERLSADFEFISCSNEGTYSESNHSVTWHFSNIPAGYENFVDVTVHIKNYSELESINEPDDDLGGVYQTPLDQYGDSETLIVPLPGVGLYDRTEPYRNFYADLMHPYPVLRLHIRGKIKPDGANNDKPEALHQPRILLTGFTDRTILSGISNRGPSAVTTNPQNGDFLGPAVFPWANKIVFTIPNKFISYYLDLEYRRTLNTPTAEPYGDVVDQETIDSMTNEAEPVYDKTLVDINTGASAFYNEYWSVPLDSRVSGSPDVKDLYASGSSSPLYQYQVDGLGINPDDENYANILTIYNKKPIYPPALYFTQIDGSGEAYLNPVDNVAPGSVKVFKDATASIMQDYQNTFPGTTAMNKRSDGTLQVLDSNGNVVNVGGQGTVASMSTDFLNSTGTGHSGQTFIRRCTEIPGGLTPEEQQQEQTEINQGYYTGNRRPDVADITIGGSRALALMMDNPNTTGTQFDIYDIPGTHIHITQANANNELNWSVFLEALRHNRSIDLLGDRLKSAKSSLVESQGYLEFGPDNDKLRLYISKTAPATANIPDGSIGIGWGFDS